MLDEGDEKRELDLIRVPVVRYDNLLAISRLDLDCSGLTIMRERVAVSLVVK